MKISSTSLDDPLYYLYNAKQVINLCLSLYNGLLLPQEVELLERFLSSEEPTQALLIRMVMRKGTSFRIDNLKYDEVPNQAEAIQMLVEAGLVDDQPYLSIETLCDLCKKNECLQLTKQLLPESHFPASIRKSDLVAELSGSFGGESAKPLNIWWPDAPFQVVELKCNDLFDRLRLMFFGNLHQTWSEFVLTELGLQQFESVPLTAESRPFQNRAEVDLYLRLHQLKEQVAAGQSIELICESLPTPVDCDWLNYRRQKVLFELGREAERQQLIDLALDLYEQSQDYEAQLRTLRILEKREQPELVFQLADKAFERIPQPEIRTGLKRIKQRCSRKAGLDYVAVKDKKVPTNLLVLPKPTEIRVEQAVIDALSNDGTQLFHVENRLFTGLFALLFWPALYAPVRGAFFNPFQSGPADLYRPGFGDTRRKLLDQGFALLQSKGNQSGEYREIILTRLEQKQAISCPLIHWPSLPVDLVKSALAIIPAEHLSAIFRHLLLDLRHHRRGLPDLIELNHSKGQYRLIEVKGPGDRLQDHQHLWIQAMLEHDIPVSVLNVAWNEG